MAERGSDIRPGQVLDHNGSLYLVVKTMHTQPGKGGAYIQAELKNLKTGAKYQERFRSDGYVKRAIVEEVEYQYIFGDGASLTLMNTTTYEQVSISADMLGEKGVYLKEGIILTLSFYQGQVIAARVPDYVVLEVVETESVIKGQTASSSYKSAVLENGERISVPPFIKTGERVVVYTVDDTYYERAKD
ncbi:translation elongation factor P [Anaplasma centrale str. Israel]|uniref:Elongation factor P n=1 Tax=Anaplasma centrale (strain Israel) TaxID=574556 RepID=D1ASB3_ANACI|nr:elongation factor P [Anaplasma centrale]ACZ49366.1 translation elongation factor P [Anaplasma centrale str. Israel]